MKILVVCKHSPEIHKKEIEHIFSRHSVHADFVWKNELNFEHIKEKDIVISIGGDGTALSAAHFLTTQPLLAVNSEPNSSEGALTTSTLAELESKLIEIKNNAFKTELLERVEVSINNFPVSLLALNEIFIGVEKAYHPAKYKLKINQKEEEQISSGIIFSTGTGSTAWFKSAGGAPFSPHSKFIKFLVREPFKGRIKTCALSSGEINEGETAQIIPIVPSVLAIDSIREFSLSPNDIVSIKISQHPLRRIK